MILLLYITQRSSTSRYEDKKMVDEYMAFHYCPPDQYMCYKFGPVEANDFTKRCAELCLKHKPVSRSKFISGTLN